MAHSLNRINPGDGDVASFEDINSVPIEHLRDAGHEEAQHPPRLPSLSGTRRQTIGEAPWAPSPLGGSSAELWRIQPVSPCTAEGMPLLSPLPKGSRLPSSLTGASSPAASAAGPSSGSASSIASAEIRSGARRASNGGGGCKERRVSLSQASR